MREARGITFGLNYNLTSAKWQMTTSQALKPIVTLFWTIQIQTKRQVHRTVKQNVMSCTTTCLWNSQIVAPFSACSHGTNSPRNMARNAKQFLSNGSRFGIMKTRQQQERPEFTSPPKNTRAASGNIFSLRALKFRLGSRWGAMWIECLWTSSTTCMWRSFSAFFHLVFVSGSVNKRSIKGKQRSHKTGYLWLTRVRSTLSILCHLSCLQAASELSFLQALVSHVMMLQIPSLFHFIQGVPKPSENFLEAGNFTVFLEEYFSHILKINWSIF